MNTRRLLRIVMVGMIWVVLVFSLMAQEDLSANRDLILAFEEEAFNTQNFEMLDTLFAEDFVLHDAASGDMDTEAFKAMWAGWFAAFPDSTQEVVTVVAEDDLVVAIYQIKGTFENAFAVPGFEFPATGEPLAVNGIDIFRVVDHEITEAWFLQDTMLMFQQMGIFPVEDVSLDELWDISLGTSSTTLEENKALVRQALESYNNADPSVLDKIMADHYMMYFPHSSATAPLSLEETQAWQGYSRAGWPDLHSEPPPGEDDYVLIAAGDLVIAQYAIVGTFTEEVEGMPPPNNLEIRVMETDIYRIENGKIVETWLTWDTMSFFEQIMAQVET